MEQRPNKRKTDGSGKPFVPIFLQQTYNLVNEPRLDHVVRWETADSFTVLDEGELIKAVLPSYFGHSNLARCFVCAFVRISLLFIVSCAN